MESIRRALGESYFESDFDIERYKLVIRFLGVIDALLEGMDCYRASEEDEEESREFEVLRRVSSAVPKKFLVRMIQSTHAESKQRLLVAKKHDMGAKNVAYYLQQISQIGARLLYRIASISEKRNVDFGGRGRMVN